MTTPSGSIAAYLHAKDGNRPHLLAQAFTDDAMLQVTVHTGAISFPPVSRGRDAIGDVLVRRFGQTFENVYTFCLGSPPGVDTQVFCCDWLVVMTEKDSRVVRVGCGRYDWCFSPPSCLAESLSITIATMQALPASHMDEVMDWVAGLPYPWCPVSTALRGAPDIQHLTPVLGYIGRSQPAGFPDKKSRPAAPRSVAPSQA
ncbi:hypothetical protein [Polaromonas aquatica]|uniref:hypothetical protein n=1 Tax=Polaromonas aquatica TaxID=332657 RepID=UPI003D64F33C